ncbi:TPA: phage antirepressor KilAC domain-containing protein [Streptococcus pyogenes]|uniref:phage antirepressor KilAC domain-containing protein n=1 Tax=Streptococcus pyogenes TaxID=1314 RepID=UPI00056E0297|nr:phage antirepressor KilAC domain-containing protein [Streptococcus pyogenes]HEQ7886526.1 phage antirepressor KilAC domain-containing protein [Streptococcus pyogenes]HEQ7906273.1 phage antirepressor KilAC domain-containing protein [Streptococcus pyogenes]HEQ7909949.1 phage antirepressor KilAC domain-containing protein [Streptococcus pyogenes]HEQ7926553.1 phage antirepressor KilAC domain-containing protein [Streptococcus pyogenes]HEQ7991036.1 phage antirepressor KilAC domain-containing protei
MNELINITVNDNHEPVVSGRDLHKVLEIKTQYTKWLERMSEYGFVENEDFMAISQKRLTAQGNQTEYTDHILKLDMAKEIAMLQRNEKSKQVRKYFIQIEKDFNSPEKIMARALLMADKKVHKLEAQIEADRPKVLFADAVSASHASILVGELAKLLKQNGVNIGATRLFAWLRKHDYLIKRNGRDWNMPTQKSVELGLIRVKETSITHSDGHITVSKTPLVTGKGQQYFINKFLNQEYLPV